MHQRAALYYETEEPDLLRATIHYTRATNHTRAAQLSTDNVNVFVGQGYARLLTQLFSEIRTSLLSVELGAKVNLAHGWVHAWLGEGDDARQYYERALTLLQTAADTSIVHQLRVQVCLNMADMLQRETPEAAIEWLQRGQTEVQGTGSLEEAAMHIKLGTAQIAMGNFRAALDAVLVGQKLLPSVPTHYHIRALLNLSTIYFYQDNLPEAQLHAEAGIQLARQLHDELLLLDIQVNLALYTEVAGNWHDATADYASALAQAEKLGNIASQAQIHNNLGILYTNLGEDTVAQEHLEQALWLARKHKIDNYLPDILASNADLHLRRGDWHSAEPLLAEAEKLAHTSGTNYPLPEILNGYAQVYLLQERTEEARFKVEESISLARQLELTTEEGKSLRTLGQVLLALGQPQAAVESFKKSANLLNDVYELARTNLCLGQALLPTNRTSALELIEQANLIFRRLGARRNQVEASNGASHE